MIRDMSQRLSSSETTFSPYYLIPLLEKYAVEHQFGVGPRNWLPDLFQEVNFAHEAIVEVLRSMWQNTEVPFTGPRKMILAAHMVYILDQWYQECLRTNTRLYGSDENAGHITELLMTIEAAGLSDPQDKQLSEDLRRKILRSFR